MYDQNNVFAKILRKEIACQKIAEGPHFLSFHDVAPKAPIHALVIPTGYYENIHEFTSHASVDEILGFWKGFNTTLDELLLKSGGYRLIANTGINGRQEVPHFHIHILGGYDLESKMAKS
jgi:histidine triad (HIT) family protein